MFLLQPGKPWVTEFFPIVDGVLFSENGRTVIFEIDDAIELPGGEVIACVLRIGRKKRVLVT